MSNTVRRRCVSSIGILSANYGSLTVLLIAATLPQVSGVPKFGAYAFVLLSYAGIGFTAIKNRNYDLIGQRTPLWCFLLVTSLLIFHLIFSPSIPELIRVPVFTVVAGMNLFFLPRLYRPVEFFHAAAVVGALFVALSASVLLVGEYGILQLYHVETDLIPLVGPKLSTVQGPFRNPNTLATVALAGALGSVGWFRETKSGIALIVLALNSFGVSISNSQAALLGLLAAVGCVILYRISGNRLLWVTFGVGTISAVALVLLTLVPPRSAVIDVLGVGRYYLWQASIHGAIDRPLGHGTGAVGDMLASYLEGDVQATTTHNGWIRLFFTSGLVGGTAYTLLFIVPLFRSLRSVDSAAVLGSIVMLVGIGFMDFFHGLSLFGLSFLSVVLSLSLGYVQMTPEASDPGGAT